MRMQCKCCKNRLAQGSGTLCPICEREVEEFMTRFFQPHGDGIDGTAPIWSFVLVWSGVALALLAVAVSIAKAGLPW